MADICIIPEHRLSIHGAGCSTCQEEIQAQQATAEFLARRAYLIRERLLDDGLGIQQRELQADINQIPAKVAQAMPTWFREGHIRGGFGLGGGVGIGKTQAISAYLQQAMISHSDRVIIPTIKGHESRYNNPFPPVRWSCWPEEVYWLRSHAVNGADNRIQRLASAAVLVLDDLGRERIKTDFTSDWATSQLDHIVNHRYRMRLPIIWTTNVAEDDLIDLYGAPMYRRLIEPNPLSWISETKPFHRSGVNRC